MDKQYSCFFISPIGAAGSEVNLRANEVYDLLLIPVLSRRNVRYMRGDENASSNHIGMDVIQCVQEADFCIVDVSYPNCNVYYELGLADALKKPVILIKEDEVDAASLPADIASRKYVSYSCTAARIRQSRSDIDAFVDHYLQALAAAKATPASPSEEGMARLEDLLNRLQSQPAESAPTAPALPMDLRLRTALNPVEESKLNEARQRLDTLLCGICRKGAHDHDKIGQTLDKLRSELGDALYLQEVKRRSVECAYIWKRYLDCAALWLEIDMTYCALDVTWLKKIAEGIELGYADEESYALAYSLCERVLALSSRRFENRFIEPVTGETRHYDEETARYYTGLCAFAMYETSHDRKHLRQAEDHWFYLRGRRSRYDDSPTEYEWKAQRMWEAESLLIEARWKNGSTILKDRLGDLVSLVQRAIEQQELHPNTPRVRLLLARMLAVSADLETGHEETILAMAQQLDDMLPAHIQRQAAESVQTKREKLRSASIQLVQEAMVLKKRISDEKQLLLKQLAAGEAPLPAAAAEEDRARLRQLLEELASMTKQFPHDPAHTAFLEATVQMGKAFLT